MSHMIYVVSIGDESEHAYLSEERAEDEALALARAAHSRVGDQYAPLPKTYAEIADWNAYVDFDLVIRVSTLTLHD